MRFNVMKPGRTRRVGVAMALVVLCAMAAAPTLPAQSAKELQLTRESRFEVKDTTRNPFWPVGWTPKMAEKAQPGKVPSSAWFRVEAFTVSSISTGGLPLAMINGRPYGEGDFMTTPNGTVQVSVIRDGTVQLRFDGKTIEVGLRRESPRAPAPERKH